jgi:hypothetical protein
MAEEATELKWEKWAGLEAVDLFTEKVKPQLNKLVTLKEFLYLPYILAEGVVDEYAYKISLGLYEILDEATDALEEYFKGIQEFHEQERPVRLAYQKKEKEAKERLEPEKLERIAETLSLEAKKFRTKAEEIRAEATGEEVSSDE